MHAHGIELVGDADPTYWNFPCALNSPFAAAALHKCITYFKVVFSSQLLQKYQGNATFGAKFEFTRRVIRIKDVIFAIFRKL